MAKKSTNISATSKKSISVKNKIAVTKTKPDNSDDMASTFTPHSTSLLPGMKAPEFRGLNQFGEEISSKQFLGKKLILYFYPKDNTPGCTAESCNLQENNILLKKEGFEIVGVSADTVKMHKKFADKYKLDFNLLADTEHAAIKAYDVWGKKKFMGVVFTGIVRTTFIINESGTILRVINKVDTKEHAQQIIDVST